MELAMIRPEEYIRLPQEKLAAILLGFNPIKIRIKDTWYDVMSLSEVVRSPSPEDGSYHFLYIQINWRTNEYYIGKVNRKRWSELKRYQGSGLKFKKKYKAHVEDFSRYFFACCQTAKETEELEASIVDDVLLSDPKCLNLVAGGGGTNEHDSAVRIEKIRSHMKAHPKQYEAMVDKAKELYGSGDSYALRQRNQKIKNTMSDDFYREQSRERILRWKEEHPEEYAQAREKNRLAMKTPETQRKKKEAREKWKSEHPEEYAELQKKLAEARSSPEAREKRKASLKAWYAAHPEEAKENVKKRSAASVEKTKKRVNMLSLETGEILHTFESQAEAAQWLVDQGIAKNTNCKSSISSVCLKKPCTTGYGYRQKAYGYGWSFADEN